MKQSRWAGLALVAGFTLVSGVQTADAQSATATINASPNARMDVRVDLRNDMMEVRKEIKELRGQAKDIRMEAKDAMMERKLSTTSTSTRPAQKLTAAKRFGLFLRQFFGLKPEAREEIQIELETQASSTR